LLLVLRGANPLLICTDLAGTDLGHLDILGEVEVILAAVGIYGAMAYAANQRTHEIGIRTALGAQRRDVPRLVMRDAARIALFGIASGIAGALALTHLMASLLFEVKPTTLRHSQVSQSCSYSLCSRLATFRRAAQCAWILWSP
jgi:ABC-type antimicrobial peptide transport system permease subunit